MLKKLLAIAAGAMLSVPALAFPTNPDGVSYNSLDSLGCMMLRECLDDVTPINNLDQLKEAMPDSDYSSHAEELSQLLKVLNESGVQVYLAHQDYFPSRHRGIYDVKGNNFFLNKEYVWDEGHMIEVMRHEGWHAAQDCMAGTIKNSMMAIIHPEEDVPGLWREMVERTYANHAVPWEAEAFWAGHTANMTKDALEACASSTPMWDIYPPTPLTKKWLKEEGYIK